MEGAQNNAQVPVLRLPPGPGKLSPIGKLHQSIGLYCHVIPGKTFPRDIDPPTPAQKQPRTYGDTSLFLQEGPALLVMAWYHLKI